MTTNVALLIGMLALSPACGHRGAAAENRKNKVGHIAVKIWKVVPRTFHRTLRLDGTLQPSKRVLIGPSIPGRITSITKQEGDRVKKGEVLVRVSPKEIYVQTIPLRAQIAAAQAQATAASTVIVKLKDPYERIKRLYKAGVISKLKLDRVEIQYTTAVAKKNAAMSTLVQLRKGLKRAYSKLSDTVLRAPFDGYVIRRLVDEGDTARAFPPTIVLVLAQIDPLYATAEVPSRYLSALHKGIKVRVQVDPLPKKTIDGTIEAIRPDVDPITRTAQIRALLANHDRTMFPGMTARISVDLAPEQALAVRRSDLASKPVGHSSSVFVAVQGKARLRRVQLGRTMDAKWVEITKGVTQGDLLVVGDNRTLFDGAGITTTLVDQP